MAHKKKKSKAVLAGTDDSRRLIIGLSVVFTLCIAAATAYALRQRDPSEQVFESVYNYLILVRDGDVIKFRRMENGVTVSAIDLDNPKRQVIPYTSVLFAAALAKSDPKTVLNVGLGAAAINRLFDSSFPNTKLTTVEIDPMILKITETYALFHQSPNDKVVLEDGRRYIARSTEIWDWVLLDAFVRNSQVPFHLTTAEFYKLISNHLSQDGVLISNLHYGTLLYESHIRTFRSVFPQVVLFGGPNTGNVIAMAVKYPTPSLSQIIAETSIKTLPDMKAWGVDFAAIKNMSSDSAIVRLSERAPMLSDDFAPVEFLDTKTK